MENGRLGWVRGVGGWRMGSWAGGGGGWGNKEVLIIKFYSRRLKSEPSDFGTFRFWTRQVWFSYQIVRILNNI